MTESKPREWTLFDGHTAEAREFIKGSDIAYAENLKVIEKSAYDQLQAELSSARSHAEVMDHKASRLNEIVRKQDKLLRECEKAIRHMHYCKYWLNKSHEDCDCNMHLIVEKLRERKK